MFASFIVMQKLLLVFLILKLLDEFILISSYKILNLKYDNIMHSNIII